MELDTPLYLALVLGLGVAAQWLAWRLKLPAIVLLLGAGFALGQWVGPPKKFIEPETLLPMVSLAVGVILFEGGLSLRFREVRDTGSVVFRLVSIGLVINWAGAAIAGHYLLDFSWPMSALFGALLTVSGPTVILPMLRQVRPSRRIGAIIKWEGIVNDPIGAVLAALVFELVRHGELSGFAGGSLLSIGRTVGIGVALAALVAGLIVWMLKHYWAPDYLQNPVILTMVIGVFALSNYLQEESGLVTVTLLGVMLANQRSVTVKHVIEFKENLRVLLIAVLFVVLSSRVRIGWSELQSIGWGGVGFMAALILLVRPAAVWISTIGVGLPLKERLLLAWVHPRGIVAAAVASLFAIDLAGTALSAESSRFVTATFLVIVVTVSVYGLTLGPLARRLGLSREDPQGVLFAGASPIVREIASSLKVEGFHTLLVDTNPQHIAAARLAGLPVCYASIGSDYVHSETDLGDIGRLMAMTPNDEVNSLAATEFAEQFGSANVYQLAPPHKSSERHERVPAHMRGRVLFGPDVTYEELQKRFHAGCQLKKTTLSEDFSYAAFKAKYGASALVLFIIPEKGRLRVNAASAPLEPKSGHKLLALVDPEPAKPKQSDEITAASQASI